MEFWESDLIAHFYFNVDGLIEQVVQFERSID